MAGDGRGAGWWRGAVLYQVYPRSWADADGDGVGDLRGVAARLDHLAWLGVKGVWLSPTMPSPNRDWGYDVQDYRGVHPELGDLAAMDHLLEEARRRDLRLLLDLVPNHTSDRHEWFLDARSSRSARHRDWYVWADPKPGGSPPNNWLSAFGGPAWTFDERTGQYYLHSFLPEQPDLNWWNPEVAAAFDGILRFWFDRGVSGFRIDVAHRIVKDRLLRDNPAATAADHPHIRARLQRPLHNADQPEVHDVLRRWRRLAESYPEPRLLVGETYVLEVPRLAPYYGRGDELQLAFNFAFLHTGFEAEGLRSLVELTEAVLPAEATPVWTGSNHDAIRFPTRWAAGSEELARCAMLMLLGLRGTVFLYMGDEIGMEDTPLERAALRDPVGLRQWPASAGRDPRRTPMQWSPADGAGFTRPGVRPWLPIGDHRRRNVRDQSRDPGSMLHLTRDLVALRERTPDLASGGYRSLPAPAGVWAWRRGEGHAVALNLGDRRAALPEVAGTVLVSTDRALDGRRFARGLSLEPRQGALVRLL